ncbi:MAG: DCC1-like thiol-disulfide oxidoreductase family protein [Bacteroidetes bacterium]|nr:DCC1-like thiol-disulfide oxidoreductase family protein [Bacteroidota bacterium]
MILFYDGECPTCHFFVRFILRFDRKKKLVFAPLQGQTAEKIKSHNPDVFKADSVVWAEGSEVLIRSKAVFRILRYLGGFWLIFLIFQLLPGFITDGIYNFVARNRYRWFGKYESCILPDSIHSDRFLG